ncbi:ATP-binding cassette subfamily B protein [Crossiella equi]|uniref:ATP-binding cassette subfamily B protein n=1 Tax=Crossiella equi TaxID=130796 RepID=A0ABS5ACN9_9PSEU|nr:ABC transporter ATP-binding protein [Crossiella equi]MBP2474348.1 ATP-binding cassette subfamily B protein [Crossiella equi]
MAESVGVEAVLAPVRSARQVVRRFWPVARANRWLLAAGVLTSVLAAASATAVVLLFASITDNALRTGDLGAFWAPALWWGGLAVATGFLTFLGHYCTAVAAERFLLALRGKVFAHLQRLSPGYFETRRRGDLLSRLTSDVESVEELVGSGLVEIVTAVLSVVFFATGAVFLSWQLAVATFVVVPVFLLIARVFSRRINRIGRVERARHGELTAVLEENLANVALVQAYRRERTEQDRLAEQGRGWMRSKLRLARLGALYAPLVHVAETASMLLVLGLGAWQIAAGTLTIGGLFAFAAFIGYLYPPLRGLGQLTLTVSAATTGSARLIEVLDAEPEVADPTGAVDPGRSSGRVELCGVTFGYAGTRTAALHEVSLHVAPGELVAVTGASGAGKSTVAKLLLRFHDPVAGSVRLDGVDLRELPLAAVRREIALLHQETLLWQASIADNIAYGRPGATREQVVAAARAADAHEFVRRLPEGYDTLVGDRGHRLSGGQRQRIAIARAMIADASVLVLDEPTAGLDAESALRVVEPLRRLAHGRTAVLITHDPALAALADRVVTVADGRISREMSNF